jgi:hypothetical protein
MPRKKDRKNGLQIKREPDAQRQAPFCNEESLKLFQNKRFHRTEVCAFTAFDAFVQIDSRSSKPFLRKSADRTYPDRRAGMILRAAVCFDGKRFHRNILLDLREMF